MNPNRRLLNEVRVNAPIDVVWDALTIPVQIQQWFGWEYEGLEAEIQQIFVDVAAVNVSEHAVRWPHGDEFLLQAEGSETRMLTYRPMPNVDSMPEQAEDIDEGWNAVVEQLRFWLEHHRGEQRATIYLSGAAREEYPSVSAALGLEVASAVGECYECSSVAGEQLAGTVWSRQNNVTGLTVEAYGSGLIVLLDHDSRRQPPHGGGMVIISTYGLPSERFERIKRQWVSAWEDKYEASSDFGAETSV